MQNPKQNNTPAVRKEKKLSALKNYGRYSSIAIQMAVIITAGVFGGMQTDKYLKLKYPVFTLALSLFAVATAIYAAIKDLIKKK